MSRYKRTKEPANKKNSYVIIIPLNASYRDWSNVRIFQKYILESTKNNLSVSDVQSSYKTIHIGLTDLVRKNIDFSDLNDHGFVIKRLNRTSWCISGKTPVATTFGIYEYLYRFLGIRWIYPSPDGVVVPFSRRIPIPRIEIRDQPKYLHRYLSGLSSGQPLLWLSRQRYSIDPVKFNHNLLNIFTPSIYKDIYPEFYPIINGQLVIPQDDFDYDWQPNFSHSELVPESIKSITTYFEQNPDQGSYSLAINDSTQFDERPETLALDDGSRNYLHFLDKSNSYFSWCNQIASHFFDKYFGVLAYNNVLEPPDFDIEDNIVTYVTLDRMGWLFSERKDFDLTNISKWKSKVPNVGIYDYVFGSPYCVPRYYPHLMAEYIRALNALGIDRYYAEFRLFFHDIPKIYILMRLLWNPDSDVDAILSDWCENAVGKNSAPYLINYFKRWEEFWMNRVSTSDWLIQGGSTRTFLPFYQDSSYLALLDEDDIKEFESLLNMSKSNAINEFHNRIMDLFIYAFQFSKHSIIAYGANKWKNNSINNKEEALQRINDIEKAISSSHFRDEFAKQNVNDLFFDLTSRYFSEPELHGDAWTKDLFWPLYSWALTDQEVKSKIEQLSNSSIPKLQSESSKFLTSVNNMNNMILISEDPSFEESPSDDVTDKWKTWTGGIGTISRSQTIVRTGTYSLECKGLKVGGPLQRITIQEPGDYIALGYYYINAKSFSGKLELVFLLYENSVIKINNGYNVPIKTQQWDMMVYSFNIPSFIDSALFLLKLSNMGSESIFFDDVGLFRIDYPVSDDQHATS